MEAIAEPALTIVTAMRNAEEQGSSLDATIQQLVHQAGGWSENLAKNILAELETVLQLGGPMNAAMRKAYDQACEAAKAVQGFAADHPVFCTVVALGVLLVLAPCALKWLGFAKVGPIKGKFWSQGKLISFWS